MRSGVWKRTIPSSRSRGAPAPHAAKGDSGKVGASGYGRGVEGADVERLEALYDPDAPGPGELSDTPDRTNNRLVARRRAVEEELKKYEEAGSDVRGLVERCSAIVGISTLGRILRGQRSGVGRMLSDNPIMILRLLGSGGDMLRLGVLEE